MYCQGCLVVKGLFLDFHFFFPTSFLFLFFLVIDFWFSFFFFLIRAGVSVCLVANS